MTALAFDTHAAVKKLQAAGFTEAQAEAQADLLSDALKSSAGELATKQDMQDLRRDMKELESNLRRDMKELESNLHRDTKELELNLRREIEAMKADLLKWVIGLMLAQIAIIAALVKML